MGKEKKVKEERLWNEKGRCRVREAKKEKECWQCGAFPL